MMNSGQRHLIYKGMLADGPCLWHDTTTLLVTMATGMEVPEILEMMKAYGLEDKVKRD